MPDPFDVGSVIARAAELKQVSDDAVTPELLRKVAAELGIEPQFVDAAVADLEQRRTTQEAARVARRKLRMRVAAAFGTVVALLLATSAAAYSSATSAWAELERHRSGVAQAMARQHEVTALYGSRAGEPDADAELTGALNRVHIAQRRYDDAASLWNGRGGFGALGAGLTGLPRSVALSAERTTW